MGYTPESEYIVVVDKQKRKTVVTDVAIPSDSNIWKKEHKKPEKYLGVRGKLEKIWKVRPAVVPVVIKTLEAVTPKMGKQLRDSMNNIRDLCPEEHSPRNNKDQIIKQI